VLAAADEAGAEGWIHSCSRDTPLDLLRKAGAHGLSLDLAMMSARDHEQAAAALEAGGTVALGVLPSLDPESPPADAQVTESVLRWLDMLGLDPAKVGEHLVLTPSCGLAGATPAWTRTALELLRSSAVQVTG
jgi:Cobalamin-independent synthase, Catalytic domain